MSNYVVYHLHSDDGSLLDSATKFHMYLDKAQEYNMKAIAFSEHGNVFHWIKKKEEVEKRGMKYIHAMEAYVTETLNEKIRDNYHMILIAKNFEGVKELNRLSSKGFNKEDGHFYYDARITLEDIMNTSQNILITTSCLGGILAKGRRNGKEELVNKFINWAVDNKDRVFLEIQYHDHPEQIEYNQWLYELSKKTGLKLIAGTDTHSLDARYAKARRILMQAKGIQFQEEDKFDLTFKSYEELIEMFEKQNSLPLDIVLKAVEFTNEMADMVEEFEIDKSPKYPKLYSDPEEIFKKKINEGVVKRGINKLEHKEKEKYYKRIKEEYEVYKKLNAIDYMLLKNNIIEWCHKNGIYQGYGRGSVTGSLIAYILGITEMDSIKHNLNFTRFMNPERQSLADIDTDFPPSRRQEVIDYVASIPGIHFSEIITFNTIQLKGAIREVGRALNYELSLVDEIAKNIDTKEDYYREKYPELFTYVDLLNGVNISVGSHPSGFLVSPVSLEENIGLFYTNESKYPVSQVNMNELDSCNYVKLDLLGLDNIEVINETCKLAGIERLTPDNVNINDEKVWESILESSLGVFQWESNTAHALYKRLFSDNTIKKIKEKNPNFNYMDLFSAGNAALRPSGDSYRDRMCEGEFADHGFEPLNDFLSDTMGYLIYQEQIQNFLVEFCGFTQAEADLVRRGLAKKYGTEQFIPDIKRRFIETMNLKYNIDEKEATRIVEPFLQVILDASSYGFSINHSQSYSYIGYINAYLRYYYPYEYITTLLNIRYDDIDDTSQIYAYAMQKGIEIKPAKFRKSQGKYTYSKKDKSIYKGLLSIKFMNENISEELYKLGKNYYNDFVDLLVDIVEKTSCNSRQIEILIKLNFFDEFGKNKRLLTIYEKFKDRYKKTHIEKTKRERIKEIKNYAKTIKDESLPIHEQIMIEKEMLGYGETKFSEIDESYNLVIEIDKKYSPKITVYNLKNGNESTIKMSKSRFYDNYENQLFDVGDVIRILEIEKRNKSKLVDGKWIKSDEMEDWIKKVAVIRRNKK